MKRILLDTNAYSAMMVGSSTALLDHLRKAGRIYLPVTVLGELFAGFRVGSKEKANRKQLRAFMATPPVRVLQTTEETADHFAAIYAQLREDGNPIPTNDIWIAAHAMEQGSQLVSYDRHFEVVPGLRHWNPDKG